MASKSTVQGGKTIVPFPPGQNAGFLTTHVASLTPVGRHPLMFTYDPAITIQLLAKSYMEHMGPQLDMSTGYPVDYADQLYSLQIMLATAALQQLSSTEGLHLHSRIKKFKVELPKSLVPLVQQFGSINQASGQFKFLGAEAMMDRLQSFIVYLMTKSKIGEGATYAAKLQITSADMVKFRLDSIPSMYEIVFIEKAGDLKLQGKKVGLITSLNELKELVKYFTINEGEDDIVMLDASYSAQDKITNFFNKDGRHWKIESAEDKEAKEHVWRYLETFQMVMNTLGTRITLIPFTPTLSGGKCQLATKSIDTYLINAPIALSAADAELGMLLTFDTTTFFNGYVVGGNITPGIWSFSA